MDISWTAHLANSPKEKKDFEDTVNNSSLVLQRLYAIIDEREKSIDRIENSTKTYQNVGWLATQAHMNGKRSAYSEIKQLLTI